MIRAQIGRLNGHAHRKHAPPRPLLGASSPRLFSNAAASRGLLLPLRSPRPILLSKGPGVYRPLARPFGLSLARFNSTNSPVTDAPLTDAALVADSAEPSPSAYHDLFDELSASDIAAAPSVHLGYLKSLGLDYGWGPTAMMEWVLEHIHVWAGTPWWLSIALTSLAVRLVMLRPALAAADTSGKLTAMRPVLEPLKERLQAAQRNRDTATLLKVKAETSDIYRRAGIKIWRPFVPMLQIFPGYGIFRLIRGMSYLPVPGFDGGGVLWFSDLTVADPYYILPTLNSLMLWRVTKAGGEAGSALMSPFAIKLLTYGITSTSFLFTIFWPAALQFSFFVTSLLSLGQMYLMRSNAFRRWAGISPLVLPTPPPPSSPSSSSSSASPWSTEDDALARPVPRKLNVVIRPAPPAAATPTASTAPVTTTARGVAGAVDASDEPVRVSGSSSGSGSGSGKSWGSRGVLGGAVAEVKGMTAEMRKSWRQFTGVDAAKTHQRSASEKRQASAYEARRQREELEQRRALEQLRRERWLSRRRQQQQQPPQDIER